MKLRVSAVVSCVIFLSGSLGCKDAAVKSDEPAGVVMGMAGSAGFTGGTNAGAGGMMAGMGGANAGAGGVMAGMGGASGAMAGMGGASGAMAGMGGASGAMAGMGGASGAMAGMGGVSGAMAGMGGTAGAMGGAGGSDGPPGPCPTGWSCEDTSVLGATDKNGKPITGTSCGKGGLVECDDANPAASCPELSKPLCAHVFGVTSCTQLCTP